MVEGLILTPSLKSRQVTIAMKFEPSVGILARKVDKLGLDIRSFREPLKRSIREVMIPSIRQNFDSEGRPKWTPLSEATVQMRGGAHPILNRTGKLRRVATQQNIWHVDREKALITELPESVWYGGVHQAGASFRTRGGSMNLEAARKYLYGGAGRGRRDAGEDTGTIPPRPFIMIQKSDEAKIERVFDRWLKERIRQAGL